MGFLADVMCTHHYHMPQHSLKIWLAHWCFVEPPSSNQDSGCIRGMHRRTPIGAAGWAGPFHINLQHYGLRCGCSWYGCLCPMAKLVECVACSSSGVGVLMSVIASCWSSFRLRAWHAASQWLLNAACRARCLAYSLSA